DAVARLHEDEADVVPHALDEEVLPDLERLEQTAGEDLDALVGLAVDQPDAGAVGGDVAELLFDRLDAVVILAAEGLVRGALGDVAAVPEVVDVEVALRVGLEQEERVELRALHDRLDVREELPVLLAEVLDPF